MSFITSGPGCDAGSALFANTPLGVSSTKWVNVMGSNPHCVAVFLR